jgi:hypothetical protein
MTTGMDRRLAQFVWQRAGARCEYCQLPQSLSRLPFEIDHIIARKHGGETVDSNLALACFYCNSFKGPNIAGLDPKTGKLVQLFDPRRHQWKRCFRWRGPVLVGRTAIGRATLAVLEINNPQAIALRTALIEEGAL